VCRQDKGREVGGRSWKNSEEIEETQKREGKPEKRLKSAGAGVSKEKGKVGDRKVLKLMELLSILWVRWRAGKNGNRGYAEAQ